MRRRVLLGCISVAMATVVLLCVPLGIVASRLIGDDFDHRLDRNLQAAAAAVVELTGLGRPLTAAQLQALTPHQRRLAYTGADGSTVVAGDVSGPSRTDRVTLPGGTLQMSAPLSILRDRLIVLWLVIVGLALAALLVGAAIAFWLSGRLTKPLTDLTAAAERLGSGDLRRHAVRSGIAELDSLGAVLDRTAVRIAAMIDDERRFARETSHQLRTPLTSLGIRLEEIERRAPDPATRSEARAALRQVERLADVVDASLSAPAPTERRAVLVAPLLAEQCREWQPAFRHAGRTITANAEADLTVHATPGALTQTVSTLVENALSHGGGAVTLRASRRGNYATVTVEDEGTGLADAIVPTIFSGASAGPNRSGLGLPLARSLVEADGGRLELTRVSPAQFTVYLPIEGDLGADGPEASL